MNILSRGLYGFLYRIKGSNDIFKITRIRSALQTMSIKQHLLQHKNQSTIEKQFLFPKDDMMPLSEMKSEDQKQLWTELQKNTITKWLFSVHDFVQQRMRFGGIPWHEFILLPNLTDKMIHECKRQLIVAVLHLHKLNVTHNDIQSRNVLVEASKHGFIVRLIDWEMSVIHEPETQDEPLFNNLGPFSFLSFAEVLDHYHHSYQKQIRFDWKRTWAIITDFRGCTWETIVDQKVEDYDSFMKEFVSKEKKMK